MKIDKVDGYKRKVGKARTLEGMDANLEQVRRGLAWHYKEYQREQTAAESATYAAAENVAREQRRALWGDPEPVALGSSGRHSESSVRMRGATDEAV